jgi:hypothetical protein
MVVHPWLKFFFVPARFSPEGMNWLNRFLSSIEKMSLTFPKQTFITSSFFSSFVQYTFPALCCRFNALRSAIPRKIFCVNSEHILNHYRIKVVKADNFFNFFIQ